MQRYLKGKQIDKKTLLIAVIAIVVAAVLVLSFAFGGRSGGMRSLSAVKLNCISTQDIKPFGSNILYYTGSMLYCLDSKGAEKWSYPLGYGASYVCTDRYIAAWSGTQLHVINQNGQATYNETLTDVIQFARLGSNYVAVVMGPDLSPTLRIKGLQGNDICTEESAYADMLLTDVGFFDNGEYYWTTALDVYGTVPDMVLNTYRVNMSSSGAISLGESLVYSVIWGNGKLNVVSTQQLRYYDYRGTQDTSDTVLVYGWQLAAHQVYNNMPYMLFTLSSQSADSNEGINQLRLLVGSTDKRYTLPSPCVGATVHNRIVYAFAGDTIYRADSGAARFDPLTVPASVGQITGFLGITEGGVALVTNGLEVYAITLP